MKSLTSWKIGRVGSKIRSLGQILEKPCVHSRGHIFSPIIMKLGENVCPDEIWDEFENGSCWVKKLGQNVFLDDILDGFQNGSCQVKN